MPRFDGIVHGVVVQISTDVFALASAGTRFASSPLLSSLSGNST